MPGRDVAVASGRRHDPGPPPAVGESAHALGAEGISVNVFVEALLANTSDAIAVSDRASGRFVVVSDSYCALTGYAREELVGRTSVEVGLIADDAARAEGLERTDQGTGGMHELRVHRKDGAVRQFEFSVQPLAGAALMLTISRDATERRDAESRLRASEQRLRAALESMPDAFASASSVRDEATGEIVDFRYEYVNDAYCSLVGLSGEQLIGNRGGELLPDFPSSERFAVYRRVVETGMPCRIQMLNARAGCAGAPARLIENNIVAVGDLIAVSGRDITERRQAERELELRAQLLDLAHDAVIVREPDESRLTFWNREAESVYGYTRAEAIGQVTHDLLATVFPESRQAVDDALAREGRWSGVLRHTRKDGRVIVVSSRQAVRRDADGCPTAIIELNSDITERHAAESRLAASEERFRAAVESMLDSFTIVSPVRDEATGEIVDFRYEHANDTHCALAGFDRAQLLGRRLGDVFVGFPGSARFALYRQVAVTGEPARTEDVSDGEAWAGTGLAGRVMDTTIVAMGDNLVISGRDVTQRREAERELRLRAQLLDLAHDAVVVRETGENRITFWNREAEAVYGYSRAEAAGQVTHDLLATVAPQGAEAMDRALARDGHWEGVLMHTRKDGRVIAISSRQALQRDADGRPTAIIALNSDITERRAAERRIRELNASLARKAGELETANLELEGFAYSVAHDLRAPLRAVAGFTDMLERGGHIAQDDASGHGLVKRAAAAAGRMGELIDALLELAQLSRHELQISRVDLTAVAGEVADELRSGDARRDVEFVIDERLEVDADPRLARILLRCLLENAWKYSRGRECARIEVSRAAGGLFVVRDNGAGFDMEFADQLFRPFGRLHRQDEFPGTGVGLATAERIVRRHGGTLRGEGRVDHGAAFYFSLAPDAKDQQ